MNFPHHRCRPRDGALILVALAVCLSSPAMAHQLSAEQRGWAEKVSALYRANAEAIRSVECDYTFHMNSTERVCRYARDGEKFYHGSVDLYANGSRGLAREGAWDGQLATHRHNPHYLTRSIDEADAKPSCATPLKAIDNYILPLLQAAVGESDVYECVDAKVVRVDGQECIELHFRSRTSGGSAVSRHPRAFRYMPTYCAYLDAAGNLQNEMPLVEYAREESEGNILYYPLHVVQHIHVAGGAQDIMRWRVDQDTLTLNRRQDGRRFVIRPWPSDVVVDLNKLTRDAPEDPQWSPVGKVGFPYDLYYKNVRPEDARSQLAAVRKLPAPGSEGGRVIGAAPAQPVLVPGAPANQSERAAWWWALAGGILLTIGGVGWSWRQRRSAT